MTHSALEGFGKRLQSSDEVVVEATGNAIAVARVLPPFVGTFRNFVRGGALEPIRPWLM
jgi:hypothetical protein